MKKPRSVQPSISIPLRRKSFRALKGITAAKAKAIIDYRSKAGAFRSTDDLTKVEGISAHTVDMQQLRKDASVTGRTVLRNESKPAAK